MTDHELFIGDLPDTLAGGTTTVASWDEPTTLELGEEGDDQPTTEMVGEEGDEPTTMMTGEEGDDGPTTMATGEEGETE